MRIEYTQRARSHILDTVDWLLERSEQAAGDWVAGLQVAVSTLDENPERYGFAPENDTHEIEIRQLHYGKRRGQHRVLFTIDNDRVVILDVRHASRLWAEPNSLDTD